MVIVEFEGIVNKLMIEAEVRAARFFRVRRIDCDFLHTLTSTGIEVTVCRGDRSDGLSYSWRELWNEA